MGRWLFLLEWHIGRWFSPVARELYFVRSLARAYEELLGIKWWPLRHPRWFVSAYRSARADFRQQQRRLRWVFDRWMARHEDYLQRGVPQEQAWEWAHERQVRDLRRIGEPGLADFLSELHREAGDR